MGLRNPHVGGQGAMDFAVGGTRLSVQSANVDKDIVAIGGPWRGNALSLCGQQAHVRTRTRRMGTTTRPARHSEHLVEGLNDFIPSQVVAHHQHLTAGGASWEFGLIDEALLGV